MPLGRIVAVLAAYALALQPITVAALAQVSNVGSVICSGANPDNAPPASHREDLACCLSSCCGTLAALSPPSARIVPPQQQAELMTPAAPTLAPARAHHPRSRAPPAQC
jgi:hypothetical protein